MGDIWGQRFHATPVHELIHVLEGNARVEFHRRSFPVSSGDTFVIPRRTVHRDVHPRGVLYRVILVFFEWPGGDAVLERIDPHALAKAPAGVKSHLHLLMKELEGEHLRESAQAADRLRLILLEVLLALYRYSLPGEERVTEAKRLVARERRRQLAAAVRVHLFAHAHEPISLERLAALHGVSPFHLCRTFAQEFGLSITDMLAQIRMERARDLLQGGRHSVKEVAFEVGFSNANYFSKVFRRVTGSSPSEFQLAALSRR